MSRISVGVDYMIVSLVSGRQEFRFMAEFFLFPLFQVFEGLKPSDKFEKTLDYRWDIFTSHLRLVKLIILAIIGSSILSSADGLLDMTSGGSASSSQRASLTREVDFGTACQTCRRSCAPAPLNATCRCPSSAGRPTR